LGKDLPSMPRYHFTIQDATWDEEYDDPNGIELPDDAAARRKAKLILDSLGRSQEAPRRDWTVEVTEGERKVATMMCWPAGPVAH
jgi:hypothetical protein